MGAPSIPNSHNQARRSYVLRGMLFCPCGRRMNGNQRYNRTYYQCWPRRNNRGRTDAYAYHPKAVYLREAAILAAVSRFLGDRVLGPAPPRRTRGHRRSRRHRPGPTRQAHPADVALLDALPYLTLNLAAAPQPMLRALFEAMLLTVHMHEGSDDVTITVTLPADDPPAIAHAALTLSASDDAQPADQPEHAEPQSVDAVRAPGVVRTSSATAPRYATLTVVDRPVVLRRRR